MMASGSLSGQDFSWVLGNLCQLYRVPFAPALLQQQFPPPYDRSTILGAARALARLLGQTPPDMARLAEALDAAAVPLTAPDVTQLQGGGGADANTAAARATRLRAERWRRLPIFLAILAAVVVAVGVVALASWRALVAATAGTAAYYLVYETLFFIVHRYLWSLSAFNTETHVKAFMNGRLVEAAVSAVIGVTVAAMVYPLLRRSPKGPRVRGYLGGWLALGPATVLLMLATLGSQVGWFLWLWGAKVTWILPDFKWGFKYDLDLIQMTAVGAVAVVAPLVTYLVGRYHPRVRKPAEE